MSHVTDTTFKVKRSKVNMQGAVAYCGGLRHSLLLTYVEVKEGGDGDNWSYKTFKAPVKPVVQPTESKQ